MRLSPDAARLSNDSVVRGVLRPLFWRRVVFNLAVACEADDVGCGRVREAGHAGSPEASWRRWLRNPPPNRQAQIGVIDTPCARHDATLRATDAE
jgi:murein endopeptidase